MINKTWEVWGFKVMNKKLLDIKPPRFDLPSFNVRLVFNKTCKVCGFEVINEGY
ncbi:hypothetical protein Cycma_0617 [Cyclobacterium marinum DSM 745]|uniref:Uncharacterized protein n=1 Tax=Cyclobacterium marinum (strain ATCC 25205 / DSM 745 / LMG 13164 / NCIMB 1802) TaxID=880070 RepID=G0IZB9_CYCMS|nr:hypothetical protein Cycma_0617 [Cyclobacterium marinum DSM 745]